MWKEETIFNVGSMNCNLIYATTFSIKFACFKLINMERKKIAERNGQTARNFGQLSRGT